jgi:diguanylate cyclase (GGDEF)-like protein/PAS domain S-box-containing protein
MGHKQDSLINKSQEQARDLGANHEQKLTKAVLRDREFQLEAIVGYSPSALSLKTTDGRYALANPNLQRIHHLSEEQIIGKTDFDLYPENIARVFKANDEIVLRTLGRHSIEEFVPVDGKLRNYMSHMFPVFDESGAASFICRISLDITDSKSAAIALKASEERMRLFIEHAPASLAMFDREMQYLAVSKRWKDDYFLGEKDIIGKSHYEIFPEIGAEWKEIHRRGLSGETIRSDEDHFQRADGAVQWLGWEVMPWRHADGSVGGILIFSEDISRFKQAEELLRLSEQRFRAIFEQAAVGIAIISPDGDWLQANSKLCNIVGYSRDELLTMSFQDITFPDDLNADLNYVQQMLAGEIQNYSMEKRYIRKDGDLIWIDLTVALVKKPDGTPDYFISIVENIQARKQALIELSKFKAIIDFSDDAIISKTLDGVITSWNKGAEKMYGYVAAEAIGNSINLLIPHELQEEESKILEKISKGERLEHFETTRIRKSGQQFYISATISPILDNSGNPVGASKIARDITESKLAEEEIVLGKTKLEAALSSMSDAVFISDAEGRFINFNDAFATFHRFKNKEECAKTHDEYPLILEVSTPEGEVLPLEQWAVPRALRGEAASNAEFNLRRIDTGETWTGSYNYAPIRNEAGHIVGSVVTARDVTLQKTAEAELKLAAAAFDTIEAIMITDDKGIIQRVNNAFIKMTGYSAEEVVGKNPRILKSGRHNEEFYRAMWESINQTGTWQGEIWDRRKNGEIYPNWLNITAVYGDDGSVSYYVESHIDITEQKSAEIQIQNLAFYDPLTKLPNRRLLQDRLSQALAASERTKHRCALLLIDLDHFKNINDTLGHVAGDSLLEQVAHRLTSSLREGDSVARIGGDEFVVLLSDMDEESMDAAAQAGLIGEKIVAQLNLPFQLGQHVIHNTASIGIALNNDNLVDFEALFKQADIAMYQAKKAGRNALRFFDPKMQELIDSRAALESDLRKAIDNKQFQLYYQIQMNSSKQPTGAEALIRWIHPEYGMVPPIQFIPLAEETGLILPIGEWVLRTACIQLKAWEHNILTCRLLLSVNVSARQFQQVDFVKQVQNIVQEYSIDPGLFKLELTESMLVENIQEVIAKMKSLKEIGIRISLDDFGTGYSSLQYLKNLPLDQLKIDQSFVRDINSDSGNNAIVSTIITMAHGLNLNVIAEGVETEEQRQFLEHAGCIHYQGYLFSKPVPIHQFENLLQQG